MQSLKILTYNLEFGGRKQLEAIYEVLAHVNADVIGLTEADDQEVVQILAERLGLHHVWGQGSGERHIALLCRFPVLDWRVYKQTTTYPGSAGSPIATPRRRQTADHLQRPFFALFAAAV